MAKNKKILLNLNNPKEIYKFLQQPTIALSEFLTGVISSDPYDFKLSACKLVQASIKGKLLTQLGRELERYRNEGKIKEDYFASNKTGATLLELLKFIDSEVPDEERLKAFKSIFLSMVAIDSGEKEEQIGYQLFQLCKKLSSMDLLILKAIFSIYQEGRPDYAETKNYGTWLNTVSDRIGYGLSELISISDDKLVGLGLLSDRSFGDKSGIKKGREFRLTSLGLKLCEYITGWDEKI